MASHNLRDKFSLLRIDQTNRISFSSFVKEEYTHLPCRNVVRRRAKIFFISKHQRMSMDDHGALNFTEISIKCRD